MKCAFVTLGWDAVRAKCLILGMSKTAAEAMEAKGRAPDDVLHTHFFNIFNDDVGYRMATWLRSAGVGRQTALEIVQEVGGVLAEMFS